MVTENFMEPNSIKSLENKPLNKRNRVKLKQIHDLIDESYFICFDDGAKIYINEFNDNTNLLEEYGEYTVSSLSSLSEDLEVYIENDITEMFEDDSKWSEKWLNHDNIYGYIDCPFCKCHHYIDNYINDLETDYCFTITCANCRKDFEVKWKADTKEINAFYII